MLDDEMRMMARSQTRMTWEDGQAGRSLDEESARLYQIMQEHSQYADLWGRLDEVGDDEFLRDGVNPEVHVQMHLIIENQIAANDPAEVEMVVNVLVGKQFSRHDAVHMAARVMLEEINDMVRKRRPYDAARYKRKLWQASRLSHPGQAK